MALSRESLLRAIKKKGDGKAVGMLKKNTNITGNGEAQYPKQSIRERVESWSSEDDSVAGDMYQIVPSPPQQFTLDISTRVEYNKTPSLESTSKDFYSLVIHRMRKRQIRMLEQCRVNTRKNQPTSGSAPVDASQVSVLQNERRCSCEVCVSRSQLRGHVNIKNAVSLSAVWLCGLAVAKFKRALWKGRMIEKLASSKSMKKMLKRGNTLHSLQRAKFDCRQQPPRKDEKEVINERLKSSAASLTFAKGGSAERPDVVPSRAKLPKSPPVSRKCPRPDKYFSNYQQLVPILQKSKWQVLNSDCTLARNLKGRFENLFKGTEERIRSLETTDPTTSSSLLQFSSPDSLTPPSRFIKNIKPVEKVWSSIDSFNDFYEPQIAMSEVPKMVAPANL